MHRRSSRIVCPVILGFTLGLIRLVDLVCLISLCLICLVNLVLIRCAFLTLTRYISRLPNSPRWCTTSSLMQSTFSLSSGTNLAQFFFTRLGSPCFFRCHQFTHTICLGLL